MNKLKVLLTGASGYVGAKIYKDLKEKDFDVVGTYHRQKLFEELIKCDLTNEEAVNSLFDNFKPDVVIHVAANASNSSAEKDPKSAVELNVSATKYLVNNSRKAGSKFIFISSFAAYSASGVYGRSKADAEDLVSTLPEYMILRPSLIVGLSPNIENDRPFNRIVKNMLNGDKQVEYDDSWKFNVTFLSHLSKLCIEIIQKNIFTSSVLPVVSNRVTSRYEIAKDILAKFNIEVTAIDEGRSSKEPEIDWSVYQQLGLSEMTYIEGIVEIIKDLSKLDQL